MGKSRKLLRRNKTKKSRRSPRKHRGGGDEEILADLLKRIEEERKTNKNKLDEWLKSKEYTEEKKRLRDQYQSEKNSGKITQEDLENKLFDLSSIMLRDFGRANPPVDVVGTLTPDERRIYTDYRKKVDGHMWQHM